jgi:hypothetical protein
MTINAPPTTPDVSAEHRKLLGYYGLFMVTWSLLESVIQAAIMKELGLSPAKAVIITGKLQFHPRVQLLIGLLKDNVQPNGKAIKIAQKIESFAHRNTIVHGLVVVGDPNKLSFLKYDGGATVKQSFTSETMDKHITGLSERTKKLQDLLYVTDADIQLIGDATQRFIKSSANK